MKCGRCQFDVSVGFAFCPGCGLKLAAAAPAPTVETDADRRAATVLFADLSGYTAVSERMDPESVKALVDWLREDRAGGAETASAR